MSTVTVVGAAGSIGSSVVEALYQRRLFDVYHFVDPRTNVLEALRIDLTEAAVAEKVAPASVVISGPEDADRNPVPSDLVVYAATAGERPGQSRSSFAGLNWGLLDSLRPVVEKAAGDTGLVLLITNPVDVMAEALCRASSQLGADRILGYSTNDSTRMRVAVAGEVGVSPDRVTAYALGVHGEQLVPIFSDVRVDGRQIELDSSQQARVVDHLDTWLDRWRSLESGRSSTCSTSAGAVSLVRAMREGHAEAASVSTDSVDFLTDDSHISMPVVLGKNAVMPEASVFSDKERMGLARAAERVKSLADELL